MNELKVKVIEVTDKKDNTKKYHRLILCLYGFEVPLKAMFDTDKGLFTQIIDRYGKEHK